MHPVTALTMLLAITMAAAPPDTGAINLDRAVVVVPDGLSGPEEKAVRMLVEEVRARSGIAWDVMLRWPNEDRPTIVVGPVRLLRDERFAHGPGIPPIPAAVGPAEGYTIRTAEGRSPSVLVAGNDERGVLFGVGRLLRELRTSRGRVLLPGPVDRTEAPRYPLRGHQLGYRPKTNSYDAWDLPQWERYIRELALFGTNAIELIPPRSDDDADSPHFPRPPMEMMVGMSQVAADYGLDVWIWYPAMDPDYSDPKTVAARPGGVGRGLPQAAADRRGLRPRRRPRPHPPHAPDGATGEAGRQPQAVSPQGADVGLAPELLRRVARRVSRRC